MRDVVLYGSHTSGHSYKVRLFLTLARIPHRYVWVDLSVPRPERPEEFRRVSQFGEVPVLVVEGTPQAQSNAILLRQARETGSFGPPRGSWDQLTTWLFWEANRIGFRWPTSATTAAGSTPRRPGDRLGRVAALADMDRLNEELTRRTFLAGDTPSIADLSASAYVFLAPEAGIDPCAGRGRCLARTHPRAAGLVDQYALMAR
jgi:glutathione S-transferase